MKFTIALLLVALAIGVVSAKSSHNKHLEEAWVHHKATMDLAYDSAEEDARRKAIFVKTDAMIQEHNSDPESTFQMAHNHFSTMTDEEKKSNIFGLKEPSVQEEAQARAPKPAPNPAPKPASSAPALSKSDQQQLIAFLKQVNAGEFKIPANIKEMIVKAVYH